MAYPSNTGGVAESQLVSIVQRVERLREEITALNADVSEVYKEARGNGFDVRTLKALISERAKIAKDPAVYQENEALLELYRDAVTRGMDRATRAQVHEAPVVSAEETKARAQALAEARAQANAGVAQSVEHQSSKLDVTGSIPVARSNPNRSPVASPPADATGDTAPSLAVSPDPKSQPGGEPRATRAATACTPSAGTGGDADRHPIPSESCVDPVSEGTGDADTPVTASPEPIHELETVDGVRVEQPPEMPAHLRRSLPR